jgi:hypothetical protein
MIGRPAMFLARCTRLALVAVVLAAAPARADTVLATYWANSGSLPPEYAWSVDVTITDTGKVTLKRCKGYETEGPACTTRTGKANAAQVQAIRLAVDESGLLANPAREAPPEEIPIGGGSAGGSVTIDGQTATLMAFPRGEDSARVRKVLSVIYAAIPQRLAKRFIEGN